MAFYDRVVDSSTCLIVVLGYDDNVKSSIPSISYILRLGT